MLLLLNHRNHFHDPSLTLVAIFNVENEASCCNCNIVEITRICQKIKLAIIGVWTSDTSSISGKRRHFAQLEVKVECIPIQSEEETFKEHAATDFLF